MITRIAATAAVALTAVLPAHHSTGYPRPLAGRVMPHPYAATAQHMCHASQLGALAVFKITDRHGAHWFVARCERFGPRDAWNQLPS